VAGGRRAWLAPVASGDSTDLFGKRFFDKGRERAVLYVSQNVLLARLREDGVLWRLSMLASVFLLVHPMLAHSAHTEFLTPEIGMRV